MNANSDAQDRGRFTAGLRLFLRDFAAFAGRRGVLAAILVALGAVLEGFSLVLIIPLLAIIIGQGLPSGRLQRAADALFHLTAVESPLAQLMLVLALFGAVMIVRAVIVLVRDVTVAKLQTDFVQAKRLRIAERLAAAPWDQVVRLRHARITHLMSGDIQRISTAANVLLRVSVSGAMLLAQTVLVFILAPSLAALAVGLLVIGAFVFVPVVRRARFLGAALTDANLTLLETTAQFLGGLKLAISQNLQANFIMEFRQNLRDLTRRQVDFVRQQTGSRLALSTVSAFAAGVLVLISFGAFHITSATLIVLLLVIARMTGPVGQIQQGLQQLAQALPVYDKVNDLEHELTAISHEHSAPPGVLPLAEGPLVFENVSYCHAGEDDDAGPTRGIHDITLKINPGEFVGISGPSGAGKTTLADLMVGLLRPEQGRIAVAGVTLEGATLVAWRDRVAYISQDPFLFHDTVRRNLTWANPEASEADLWDALALVGADELVRRMERGLDTVVGERGTLVSGGERQRLALARASLRKPRMMVLDEATSAIDVAGEREILERLRAMKPCPAIIVIAHRQESLAFCERVLRLDDGRCVGSSAVPPRTFAAGR